jgi:hypothetical protein
MQTSAIETGESAMSRTVLFVHGTGVRKASFEVSAARIAEGLRNIDPAVQLRPCLWGDEYGARLGMNGASIPEYVHPLAAATDNDASVALWDLLAHDCLFELRELAAIRAEGVDSQDVREEKERLRAALPLTTASEKLVAIVIQFTTQKQWQDAVFAVLDGPAHPAVIEEAIKTARIALTPLRFVLARAFVAALQQQLADANVPVLSKDTRDNLVLECVEHLGGRDMGGALDWFKSRLVGLGLNWATAKARREREALFGMVAPMAGDVVMYQARGQAIRNFIEQEIARCDGEVILLAHSLGGIACVDLLIEKNLPQVAALVTVGTQAPFLYEIDALSALPFGKPLPNHFPKKWRNVFDCNDLLSYKAAKIFPSHAIDVEVTSGQPFPHAHSAYWGETAFLNCLADALN